MPESLSAKLAEFEARVMELESRLAHQESTLDDLNGIVVAQRGEIDLLNRQVTLLVTRSREADRGGEALPANDGPPPHY
jgi:SlyX protein|tara:strand:- start:5901 stop:6137 length:237 start_codon:yes stop_codon:yes gene_type:complete